MKNPFKKIIKKQRLCQKCGLASPDHKFYWLPINEKYSVKVCKWCLNVYKKTRA